MRFICLSGKANLTFLDYLLVIRCKIREFPNQFGQLSKKKPVLFAEYNKYMSDIDHVNKLIGYYSCAEKSMKK